MNIFTLFMLGSFPTALLLNPNKSQRNKKWFCIIEGFYMVLISALHGNYSNDMVRYAANFSEVANGTWGEAFSEEFHTGLYVFVKFLSCIWDNTQFYYAVFGLIFAIAVGLLIYKHSPDPLMSYVILVPLGYFGFALTGIAQGVAISLAILAYLCIENKKYISALVLIILAATCHTSAYVAIIFYILYKVKVNKITMAVLGALYIIIFTQRYTIGGFLVNMVEYREYEVAVSNGGLAELFIYIAILFAAAVSIYRLLRERTDVKMCFLTCVCGAMLFTFVPVLTEFFRVAMYFNIFVIVLVPIIISGLYKKGDLKQKLIIDYIIYGLFFIVYFGFTHVNSYMHLYKFFWV